MARREPDFPGGAAAWRAADARLTDATSNRRGGRFHPVVLLPVALLGKLTAPQMDAVLAHEREHIPRRDNLKANFHRAGRNAVLVLPAGLVDRPPDARRARTRL